MPRTRFAIPLAVAIAVIAPRRADAGAPPPGGHADLCVVGDFYRAARTRRVSHLLLADSNGINADGTGSYGYVKGLQDAAFEDDTYECWALGIVSGTFNVSTSRVFSPTVSPPIAIGDPVVLGFASAYRGLGNLNGQYFSVRNNFTAGPGATAGLRSVTGADAPPWFQWESFPLNIHYTTFQDDSEGAGSLGFRLTLSGFPIVVGPTIPTNGAAQDTIIDTMLSVNAGDLYRTDTNRIILQTVAVNGEAVWNYIIPEIPTRRTGFHFAQLWVEGGGRASDAAFDLDRANPVHLDKFFERLSTVQDEDEPMLVVEFELGGNDWMTGGTGPQVVADLDSMKQLCDQHWLANGNALENIVYLVVGYHPRSLSEDFGFRNDLKAYALSTPRVAFYDPAAEFTLQDMIDFGYSDDPVTGDDPHMSDLGYRAFSKRQLEVVEAAADPDPADFNADGAVDTADLGLLLSLFGTADPQADLNGDGIVDTADLGQLIQSFGSVSCPPGA
ncbi:MAG: hypothetical protein H6813_07020 [Phycisphaeraceae bacterium]|nr:hypothetical protein [Phycisphaeraceae bacterium]MCB9848687.1 hypothetical protein [Phycisphaeraceae bacterium]